MEVGKAKRYIYEQADWPSFYWDYEVLSALLGEVRNLQGRLLGKMENLGFSLREEANMDVVSTEVLKSHEIEDEFLSKEEVRSSVARHLGMSFNSTIKVSRNIDGVVKMMLDATENHHLPISEERMFDWHNLLFAEKDTKTNSITIGEWRKGEKGPMRVVSGSLGREKIHFEAMDSTMLDREMNQFLTWFNAYPMIDPVIKAGVAHLWFLTIHPFEDGNGRIARGLTDLLLARSDDTNLRFYSMSAQILKDRKGYYQALEKTQKGGLDITIWLVWFLNCLKQAINDSERMLKHVLRKAEFWKEHQNTLFNKRQDKMIQLLFGEFYGNLTSTKWAKLCKCSQDTALRDIQDLQSKQVLYQEEGGGRSTSYQLQFNLPKD